MKFNETITGKVNGIINRMNIEYSPDVFKMVFDWVNVGIEEHQIIMLINDNTHFFKPLPLFNRIEDNKIWINKTIINMTDAEKAKLIDTMWDNGQINVTQK